MIAHATESLPGRADPTELAAVEPSAAIAHHVIEDVMRIEDADGQTVTRRLVVDVISGNHAACAVHVLDDSRQGGLGYGG